MESLWNYIRYQDYAKEINPKFPAFLFAVKPQLLKFDA